MSSTEYSELSSKCMINTIYRYVNITKIEKLIICVNSKITDTHFIHSSQYYSWLFQDSHKFTEFINHPRLNPRYVYENIYYCFGKHISKGSEADDAMQLACEKLNSTTCLRVLNEFNLIENDTNLALTLISRLDENQFSLFTQENDLTLFFQEALNDLDKVVLKKYFIRNISIYNLIIQIFKSQECSDFYNQFMKKYKNEIVYIEDAIDISKNLDEITHEQMIDINNQRNACLDILIKELRKKENPLEIISILFEKGFFFDEAERRTVEFFITNAFV